MAGENFASLSKQEQYFASYKHNRSCHSGQNNRQSLTKKLLALYAVAALIITVVCIALSEAAPAKHRLTKSNDAKGINSPVKLISIKRATSSKTSSNPKPKPLMQVGQAVAAHLLTAAAHSVMAELSKRDSSSGTKGSSAQSTKHRKPSKIYNLPVKFAANGKPESLVTSIMRQRLSTIKKGQQQDKKNKSKPMRKGHVKGSNSKIIYLPLKHLSNAKPYGVKIQSN